MLEGLPIMLYALACLLCSKLCRHNRRRPIVESIISSGRIALQHSNATTEAGAHFCTDC